MEWIQDLQQATLTLATLPCNTGNMEWIQDLVDAGHLSESEAWRPWFNTQWPGMPAGYVTAYNVTGAPSKGFHFLKIRLAGQY